MECSKKLIVIKALQKPEPKLRRVMPPFKSPRSEEFELLLQNADKFQKAKLEALEGMKVLVGHVLNIMSHPSAQDLGICQWLEDIYGTLGDEDLIGTILGLYDPSPTIDSEGISSLDSLLQSGWMSRNCEISDTPEGELLEHLIEYWTEEVRSQGYQLIYFLIDAVICSDVETSFEALSKIRYPAIT